jgi:hypothetical protein
LRVIFYSTNLSTNQRTKIMKQIEQRMLKMIHAGEAGQIGSANGGGSNASYGGPAPAGPTSGAGSVACTNAQNTALGAATVTGMMCGLGNVPGCIAGAVTTGVAVNNANNACAPANTAPATVAAIATPAAPAAVAESSGGEGGSGCVICTQLTRTGNMDISTWSAAQRYGNERFSAQVMNGYHTWGVPYVKLMRKSPLFAAIAKRPVNWFAEDLAYRMGARAKPNYMGWALRELAFRPVCWSIGVFAKARDFKHLWATPMAHT